MLIEGYILKRFGCAISAEAKIHSSVRMGHPIGIVIGAGSIIDRDVQIFQNVTLGRIRHEVSGCPHIMEGCTIYTGAVILGPVKIGRQSTIGALSIVTNDIPDGSCFMNKRIGIYSERAASMGNGSSS